MVGFVANADPNERIRTDLDNELADARWYTREEVLTVLNHADGTNISRREYKRIDDNINGQSNVANKNGPPPTEGAGAQAATAQEASASSAGPDPKDADEPLFRCPPMTCTRCQHERISATYVVVVGQAGRADWLARPCDG